MRDPLALPVSLADEPKNLDIHVPTLAAVARRESTIAHTDPAIPCLIMLVNKPPISTYVTVEACEVDMYVPQAMKPTEWSPVRPVKPAKK